MIKAIEVQPKGVSLENGSWGTHDTNLGKPLLQP